MNVKSDLVSIIIPTYGRCDYLQRTVHSVLNQTHQSIEVIVVDDNGKSSIQGEKTKEIMKSFADYSNVKYIQHEMNRNGSVARNTGLAASEGEYIAYLDDDDEFLPKKIEIQIAELKSSHNDAAVYCLNSKFYNGKLVQTTTYNKSGNCQFDILNIRSDIHTSSLLIRKQVIIDMGGWDETFIRHQDYEFLIRFFENNTIICIPDVLLKVHVESEINRPNVDKLLSAKVVFFNKLDYIVAKYSVCETRDIHKAHNLELFRVCVKNMDIRLFKYFVLARPSLSDIRMYIYPVALKYVKRLFPNKA